MLSLGKVGVGLALVASGWIGAQALGPTPEPIVRTEERPIIVPDPQVTTITKEVPVQLSKECIRFINAAEESVTSASDIASAGPRISNILGEIQQITVSTVGNDPAKLVEYQAQLRDIQEELSIAIQVFGNRDLHHSGTDNPCLGE